MTAKSTVVLKRDPLFFIFNAESLFWPQFLLLFAILAVAIVIMPFPASAQLMVTPGKVDVSPKGDALYTVPIDIPPGTAQMSPSLSLRYDSLSGDGPVGVGWAMSGLSEVDRCGRTIIQDGVQDGINFGSNDRFCLDGQRLVAVSGTYGADGTEYRTETESFGKIISHGTTGNGPAWWEVHSKAGQIMEFGNSPSSKAMLNGIASVKAWLVNKITDAKGNYVDFTYANNFVYSGVNTGEVLPSSIAYTGNVGAGLSPQNVIEFTYETRPDVVPLYHAGIQTRRTQRLTHIKTKVGTSLVRDYRLTYSQSVLTNRSLVSTLSLCDSSGACLPATNFSWTSEGLPGAVTQVSSSMTGGVNLGVPPTTQYVPITGDFNGDGKTDTAYFTNGLVCTFISNGNGTFAQTCRNYSDGVQLGVPPTTQYTPITGDFNGDGNTDVAFFTNGLVCTFISNGNGTFAQTCRNYSDGVQLGVPPTTQYTPITGDFNGDGKTDASFFTYGLSCTFISNGNGTFAQTCRNYSSGITLGAPPASTWASISGNLNGDALTDVAFFKNSTICSFISNGNGTFAQSCSQMSGGASLGSPPSAAFTLVPGDLNGDGKIDASFFTYSTSCSFLSLGNGSFEQHCLSLENGNTLNSPPTLTWTPAIGDVNGDGKIDVTFFKNNKICSYISRGNGSFDQPCVQMTDGVDINSPPTATWALVSGDMTGEGKQDAAFFQGSLVCSFRSNGDGTYGQRCSSLTGGVNVNSPPSSKWSVIEGDFNGDGRSDSAFFSGQTIVTFLSSVTNPDLITSVNSPAFGATTSITYTPITNNTVYTKGSGSTFPKYDYQGPLFVVSALTSPNGIGGTYTSTYTYTGARFHLTGRGFLGFASQSVTDSQTGVMQTTNYAQDFPYTGMLSSQTKVLGSTTLNSLTNTFALGSPPWSGTYFPYVSQKVTTSKDLDGTTLPSTTTTYTYDAYGNATSVVNSTSDGASQTTTSTYTNDTTNWYLGRLSGSSVTNSTP